MPPVGDNKVLDQVKKDLRSMLISAKYGVPLNEIQKDYENLVCSRLPYRDLGFKDVQSFMKSIPDVAFETTSPEGIVVYKAVSDASTAHIQKMVSLQNTKKKIKSGGRGRGRGGRGAFRGRGVTRGIGSRGGSFTASRQPQGSNFRGRGSRPPKPGAARFSNSSSRGGFGSTRKNQSDDPPRFKIKSAVTIPEHSTIAHAWEDLEKNRHEASSSGSSQFDSSRLTESSSDDWNKENQQFLNLKIGVNSNGQRSISTAANPKQVSDLRELIKAKQGSSHYDQPAGAQGASQDEALSSRGRGSIKKVDANYSNTQSDKAFFAPRFAKLKQNSGTKDNFNNESSAQKPKKTQEDGATFQLGNVKYTHDSKNWQPPEDGELYLKTFQQYFANKGLPVPEIEIVPGKYLKQNGYYGRFTYNDQLYYPLEILHTEEQARQNAARTFCLENNIPLLHSSGNQAQANQLPVANFTPSWLEQSSDLQSMLQINPSPEKRWADSVSSSPDIPPPTTPPLEDDSSLFSTPTRPGRGFTQQPNASTVQSPPSTVQSPPSSVQSGRTLQQSSAASSVPSHSPSVPGLVPPTDPNVCSAEVMEQIYKILKPSGLWANAIPKLYESNYGTVLTADVTLSAQYWSEYFNVETPFEGRFIVYPVPEGANRLPSLLPSVPVETTLAKRLVPECELLPIGCEKAVLFSFAYSGDELYFQLAENEDLVATVDQLLYDAMQGAKQVTFEELRPGDYVAASYQDAWYRAKIISLDNGQVAVYFIDYGNSETVTAQCVRHIPNTDILWDTPAQALKCAVRRTKTGEWLDDITSILDKISDTGQTLTARVDYVVEDLHVIDLLLGEGRQLINTMLLRAAEVTPQAQATPVRQTSQPAGPSVPATPTVKVFAEDPEPLVIPDEDEFAVYHCSIMSEDSVLLRVIDAEYSDKLDELQEEIAEKFESWPEPKEVRKTNVYACVCYGDEEAEEEDKYYRVRVVKINKEDNTYEVHFPDHGDTEIVTKDQLREIDQELNTSLPYQAILARLYGFADLTPKQRETAIDVLVQLLESKVYTAVKKGECAKKHEISEIDPVVINRVRKIVSCVAEVDASSVATVYEKVFKEKLENVEQVIRHIPGFGQFKQVLEIELVDTTDPDKDVNINQTVLEIIAEVEQREAEGRDGKEVIRERFPGSSSCGSFSDLVQGDMGLLPRASSNLSSHSGSVTGDPASFANPRPAYVIGGGDADTMARVENYVHEQARMASTDASRSLSPQVSGGPTAQTTKSLYTWNQKQQRPSQAYDSQSMSGASWVSDEGDQASHPVPALPPFWQYDLEDFNSVHIISAESPAHFVGIPLEKKGDLLNLESSMLAYFSELRSHASCLSRKRLYAVNKSSKWQRALYVNNIGKDLIKVFYPDLHQFDTIYPPQLFELPDQFYQTPFLARRMRLGVEPDTYPEWKSKKTVLPTTQDWSESAKYWFITKVQHKSLFAFIRPSVAEPVTEEQKAIGVPSPLEVQLVDTSGAEDVIIDEVMCHMGLAKRPFQADA